MSARCLSVVKLARTLGQVAWTIDIPPPKAKSNAITPEGKHDLALVRPMRELGFLRGEAVALDLAGGDVRKVKRFSRHAKGGTLLKYDDNRRDEAGANVKMLEKDLSQTEFLGSCNLLTMVLGSSLIHI